MHSFLLVRRGIMLFALLLLIHLLSQLPVQAQTVALYQPDVSSFPTVRAKLVAVDAAGNRLVPTTGDIRIVENGVVRSVSNVQCPPSTPLQALSSLLVMDVSASMAISNSGSLNLDMAKAAATAWLKGLALGNSECALSSFDDYAYLVRDFSTDRAALLQAVSGIRAQNGTDYNAAFLAKLTGAFDIAQYGRYKRIIVFLTDGLPQNPTDESTIIARAQSQNCTVYCLTLGLAAPPELKNIAAATGGICYEHINDLAAAEDVYRRILQREQHSAPCVITWQSCYDVEEALRGVQCTVLSTGTKDSLSYTLPQSKMPQISFNPPLLHFGDKLPGSNYDTTIVVRVTNTSLTVSDIQSSNPSFTISPTSFSLKAGGSIALKVRYTPTIRSYEYTTFNLNTSLCGELPLYVSGGNEDSPPVPPTLHLSFPDGGEVFGVGADTLIRWEGIPSSDTVMLHYSSNAGATWNLITSRASGGAYRWQGIPNTPASECLMRVRQVSAGGVFLDKYLQLKSPGNTAIVYGEFSPDGNWVATCSGNAVQVWDARTGLMKANARNPRGSQTIHARFSADSRLLAMSSNDSHLRVISVPDGAVVHDFSLSNTRSVLECTFSPNDTLLASSSIGLSGTVVSCHKWRIEENLFELIGDSLHFSTARNLHFNAAGTHLLSLLSDGDTNSRIDVRTMSGDTVYAPLTGQTAYDYNSTTNLIAGCGGDTLSVWAESNGNLLHKRSAGSVLTVVRFSKDGSLIATATGTAKSGIRAIQVWESSSGKKLTTIPVRDIIYDLRFSADKHFIYALMNTNQVEVWDVSTSTLYKILGGQKNTITSCDVAQGGTSILTTSYDFTARIWQEGERWLQEDVSDKVWSIATPTLTLSSVNMGAAYVGSRRDSVFSGCIRNSSSLPISVKDIRFSGNHATDFSLVSGAAPFTLQPGEARDIEIRFTPQAAGLRLAQMEVHTQTGVIKQSISGAGASRVFGDVPVVIDFGQVEIGQVRDVNNIDVFRNLNLVAITDIQSNIASPDAQSFRILSTDNTPIASNKLFKVSLQFAPTQKGRTSARLLLTADKDPLNTQTIVLFGEGVRKGAQILASAPLFAHGSCSAQSFDTVHVTNTGNEDLLISAAQIKGTHPGDFSITPTFQPLTIAPRATKDIVIAFHAKDNGVRSALLELQSNSMEQSTLSIEIQARKDEVGISALTETIDVGVVCPDEAFDARLIITNIGESPNTVSINSALIEPMASRLIAPKQNDTLLLRLKGRANGLFSVPLVLRDALCNNATAVTIKGEALRAHVEAEDILIEATQGYTRTVAFMLRNSSQRTVTIDNLPDISPLQLSGVTLPLILAPKDSIQLRLSYTPENTTTLERFAVFRNRECSSGDTVYIKAAPVIARATLRTMSVSARAGENLTVGIKLADAKGLAAAGVQSFKATLRYNASLLAPIAPTPKGSITDGMREIAIDIPATIPTGTQDSILLRLPFLALLGNDTSTALELRDIQTTSSSIILNAEAGRFSLTGVCNEGGLRLYYPSGQIQLLLLKPHPVSDHADVDIETIEEGRTQLLLMDMSGRIVQTILDSSLPTGIHTLHLDLGNSACGAYWLILQTPTEQRAQRMEVVK